ncbi:hypothetical protein P4E94_19920, partial [Pontiellaceae bacterium B12219]|nr:hypothetical protein [Pontiellaceae bacterium B12219]
DSIGAGSVDVSNQWVSAESNVVLTAAASNNYHFAYWSGDTNESVVVGDTITVPMTQVRSISAVFALNEHTFEVASAHGVTEPVAGIYTNSYGTALSNSVDSIETLGSTQYV